MGDIVAYRVLWRRSNCAAIGMAWHELAGGRVEDRSRR